VKELKKLRKDKEVVIDVKMDRTEVQFEELKGSSQELLLDQIKVNAGQFKISFRNEAYLCFDSATKEILLQRRSLKTGALETRACKLSSVSKLHIFMDQSSLEIFINDGEEVFTARYFPNPQDETIRFYGDAAFRLTKWNLG
jgi:beta-fructofuranosidase